MRPEAHVAAAIDVLDAVLGGMPAERSLTNWARANRFAGSGDRAAIRDIVFDALRRRRSYAWSGGAETGRGLMIGRLRMAGTGPEETFTGEGYAPKPLSVDELTKVRDIDTAPEAVRLDCPDWLWPIVQSDLGSLLAPVLSVLRDRAPVFLRSNLSLADRAGAISVLREDGIEAEPHELASTALLVTTNARRVRSSRAFEDGLVELQDAASQAVVEACLTHLDGNEVLDFCAGGGGKALALAGAGVRNVTAHDANPARMKDIPARARRAHADIQIVDSVDGLFDLVLCDAPCSGSGAWRRQPEGKWALNTERLTRLNEIQDIILEKARHHVREHGFLAYATCSILTSENDARADAFLTSYPEWNEVSRKKWTPLDGGDGFFLAVFRKS